VARALPERLARAREGRRGPAQLGASFPQATCAQWLLSPASGRGWEGTGAQRHAAGPGRAGVTQTNTSRRLRAQQGKTARAGWSAST